MPVTESELQSLRDRRDELRSRLQEVIRRRRERALNLADLEPETGLARAHQLFDVEPQTPWQPKEFPDRTQTLPQLLGVEEMLEPEEVPGDAPGMNMPTLRNAARSLSGLGLGFVELPRKLLTHSIQDKIDAVKEIEEMIPGIAKEDVRSTLGSILGTVYDAISWPLGDREAGERLGASGGLEPAITAGLLAYPKFRTGRLASRARQRMVTEAQTSPGITSSILRGEEFLKSQPKQLPAGQGFEMVERPLRGRRVDPVVERAQRDGIRAYPSGQIRTASGRPFPTGRTKRISEAPPQEISNAASGSSTTKAVNPVKAPPEPANPQATTFDVFVDYWRGVSADPGFRPPSKPLRGEIRKQLRAEKPNLKGKALNAAVDAEFNRQAREAGIALRTTPSGRLTPAVRTAGSFVSEEFANYKGFKDAKKGPFGGTKQTRRLLQEIDGALSPEAKSRLAGQAGPTERFVLWRTRDLTKMKLDWINEKRAQLTGAAQGISNADAALANQILERMNRVGQVVGDAPRAAPHVVEFARFARQLLDEMLGEENIARKMRQQPEIPRRQFYTPHELQDVSLWERTFGLGKEPTQIMQGPGLPDYIKPNKPFNPRELARTAGLPEFAREMNLKRLLEHYINTAGRDIFDTSIIQSNKAHAEFLESAGYGHAARAIQDWTAESFGGIKAAVDRAVDLPGTARRYMRAYRQARARTVFGFNVLWNAGIQTSSYALTPAWYGMRNAARGAVDWFTKPSVRRDIADTYAFRMKTEKMGRVTRQDVDAGLARADRIERGFWDRADDAMFFLNEQIEKHLSGMSGAAALRDGMQKGLRGESLRNFVSDGIDRTQSMYNSADLPGILRSSDIKTAGPFQTFAFEMWNTMKEVAGKTGMPPETALQKSKAVLRFLGVATAMNIGAQQFRGRNAWDVGAFIPFWSQVGEPALDRLAGKPVSQRALASPLQLLNEFAKAVEDIFKEDKRGRSRKNRWARMRRWAVKHMGGYFKMPGVQMNRMIDAAIAIANDGVVEDVAGNEMFRFPVSDAKEITRSLLGGPFNTEAGQGYIQDVIDKPLIPLPEALPRELLPFIENLPVMGDLTGESPAKRKRRERIERLERLRNP